MRRFGALASVTRNHCAGVLRLCRATGGDLGRGISDQARRQRNLEILETIIIDFETHVEHERVQLWQIFYKIMV